MYEKVRAYIQENKMIAPGCTVIAGVSGGGDSMAMLSFLKKYQEETDFSLYVVHVHHGIRGAEADRDAQLVCKTCESWKIPCRVYHYLVPELARQKKIGTEEAGRIVRREAFEKERTRLGLNEDQVRIALAHNENDLAETVIHNLCRGSGIRGLAAMQASDGRTIRPVLCLEKQEIGDYLKQEKIPYILDSSNLSDDYTRNRIRHHVLPLMEKEINTRAMAHLAETARVAGQAEAYLLRQGEMLLEQYGKTMENGSILLTEEFFGAEEIVVSYGVMKAFERLSGKRKDFTSGHVREVTGLLGKQVGRRLALPYGLAAERAYQGIRISRNDSRKEAKSFPETEIPVPGMLSCPLGSVRTEIFLYKNQKIEEKKYTKWLDYDKINYNLSIRTRKTGDYLIVDSRGSHKKLNRFLIDEKIPAEKRDGIPLIAAGSEILWIVGGRINERYKITSETSTILDLQYEGGTYLL